MKYSTLLSILIGTTAICASHPAQARSINHPSIVIDPGHGGVDGGATGANGAVLEKQLNLEIAKKLYNTLQKDGFSVWMTRDSDTDVTQHAPQGIQLGRYRSDLLGRATFIEKHQADILISIHGNVGGASDRGAIVFFKKDSLTSYSLAAALQAELNRTTGVRNRVLPGRYYILRKPKSTSVLVETGFLTNDSDLARLRNPEYQQRLVHAMERAILQYAILYPR